MKSFGIGFPVRKGRDVLVPAVADVLHCDSLGHIDHVFHRVFRIESFLHYPVADTVIQHERYVVEGKSSVIFGRMPLMCGETIQDVLVSLVPVLDELSFFVDLEKLLRVHVRVDPQCDRPEVLLVLLHVIP